MHSHEYNAERIEGSTEPRHSTKVSNALHEHSCHSEKVHEIQKRDVRSRSKRILKSLVKWKL